MPFCPSCRCEYRMGFRRCNDCGVELVDSLPAENREFPDTREFPGCRAQDLDDFSRPRHLRALDSLFQAGPNRAQRGSSWSGKSSSQRFSASHHKACTSAYAEFMNNPG